jgi:hypothetical protein
MAEEEPRAQDGNGEDEASESGEKQERAQTKDEKQRELEEFHPTAPSLGPHTVIERPPPEERLAKHEQSPVDAMGKDKRRAVVGHSYGPSTTRQAVLYGAAVLVVVVLAIGAKLLIDSSDKFPSEVPHQAPWAQPDAKQAPPKPLQ